MDAAVFVDGDDLADPWGNEPALDHRGKEFLEWLGAGGEELGAMIEVEGVGIAGAHAPAHATGLLEHRDACTIAEVIGQREARNARTNDGNARGRGG